MPSVRGYASGNNASPKKRTVEDASERPSLSVYVDLLRDEAVLRAVAKTRLERNGVCESAPRSVEHGAFWLGEGRQALGEVLLGERLEGTT